uniref:3FTx-Lio2 n=1 Tax=Erythrolamprus poecilogyrus TaxID=338838 RepID=A7X3P2_ERYPO|nr:3FTx-Lio2 [Erythrolamprus poecilogyrus]
MKTLLLSLMVVAFMYLDSGDAIICKYCDSLLLCNTFQNCSDAQACSILTSGIKIMRRCANECILPAAGETIKYCAEDRCN